VPVGTCFQATSLQGAVVTYNKPTASDAVSGSVAVTCDKASGVVYPVGSTTVRCTACDASGNTAVFVFTIQVCDTQIPVLSQPLNISCVEATSPAGAVVTFVRPTATDLADPNPVVTCTPPSGAVFPLGTTIVKCDAADRGGNKANPVFFSVKVSEREWWGDTCVHASSQRTGCESIVWCAGLLGV
jgi:hypothetical protein